jgi:hypothetical protein
MKKILVSMALMFLLVPFASYAQGCAEAGDDEGIKVFGYIQPQYEYQFLGDSVQKFMRGMESESTFYFNRARLGVVGNIPYDFAYYFLAEFSPTHGGPYILDAFVTYKRWAPYINISMGQFKAPFGLELQTSCSGLYSVDRSRVVSELASPFRVLGVLVWGGTGEKKIFGLENKDIFKWQLAVTNGTGQNAFDTNSDKDFTGRLVFQPFEGFGIGGSYKFGRQAPIQAGMIDDTRSRWGVELSLEKYNFLLQGEYISGLDKGSSLIGGGCGSTPTIVKGDFDKAGYWAALMYTFKDKFAPIVKYQYYNVHTDIQGVDDQTMTEMIVGFNYYFNDWTRFQLNYVITNDSYLSDDKGFNKNYLVVQAQIKFN